MITFMHLTEVLNLYCKGNKENLDVAGYPPYFINIQKSILPKETLDIFNYSGTSEIPKPKKIVLRVSRLVRVVNGK
jgi:hypothetical protein